MDISKNIKKIRLERGLTQKQVAEQCGMAEANFRKYELGKANPTLETLSRISYALNIDLFELIRSEGTEEIEYKFESGKEILTVNNEIIPGIDDKMIYTFHKLNYKGQEKALEQVEMLTKIEEYTKKED